MSNTATVLAFDFGASSGRAIRAVYDGQNLTYEEIHRFENVPIEKDVLFDGDIFKTMDFLVGEVLAIVHGPNRTSTGSAKIEGQHSCCVTH